MCYGCKQTLPLEDFHRNKSQSDGHNNVCKVCVIAYQKNLRREHPERVAGYKRTEAARLRRQVLETFGSKCCKCGFADHRALQLDHINGGGLKEKRERGSSGIYRRALKYPEDYQLLCANCNIIKYRERREYLVPIEGRRSWLL